MCIQLGTKPLFNIWMGMYVCMYACMYTTIEDNILKNFPLPHTQKIKCYSTHPHIHTQGLSNTNIHNCAWHAIKHTWGYEPKAKCMPFHRIGGDICFIFVLILSKCIYDINFSKFKSILGCIHLFIYLYLVCLPIEELVKNLKK